MYHLKLKLFFPSPGAITMFEISEIRVFLFNAVLCMLRRSSTEAYSVSVSFILSFIYVPCEMIFSVTLQGVSQEGRNRAFCLKEGRQEGKNHALYQGAKHLKNL